MSFPRYPSYKDSGVEWLGKVPEKWQVGPIKRLIQKVESGTSVNASDEPAEGGKLGVLKTSCVYTGTFDPDENKTVVEEDIGRVSCPLKAGTLIVSRMNTPELIGAAGLVTQTRDNLYLPDRLWQVSFSNADPHFVHYWTLTSLYRGQVKAVCTGTSSSMKNLGQDQFGAFSFAAPPVAEQTAIAEFLDRETGKIDELVAEQRRLMELLKEKRQAVISHAVTRGLNPAAPLKPSGIEWLGDVPAHWTVIKLGLVSTFKGGAGFPDEYQGQTENEIPFFKVGDIVNSDESGVMRQANHAITRETAKLLRAFIFPPNTIVFAKVGAALLLKRFRELGQPSCIDNNMMGMTAGKNVCADFLLYVLPLLDLTLIVNPGAVPSINEGQISSQRIALPPLDEQATIVEFLNAETAKFDILTAEAQRAIDLLQERRTALISAAVTGQIDVRGGD